MLKANLYADVSCLGRHYIYQEQNGAGSFLSQFRKRKKIIKRRPQMLLDKERERLDLTWHQHFKCTIRIYVCIQ